MQIVKGLNLSAEIIWKLNEVKGFWSSQRNVGELLMLVTSELGEAMEAHRKGSFADWKLYKKQYDFEIKHFPDAEKQCFESFIKDTFEDEIADAVIRLLDLAHGLGIDLEKHINAKVKYNMDRPYLHGKKY